MFTNHILVGVYLEQSTLVTVQVELLLVLEVSVAPTEIEVFSSLESKPIICVEVLAGKKIS